MSTVYIRVNTYSRCAIAREKENKTKHIFFLLFFFSFCVRSACSSYWNYSSTKMKQVNSEQHHMCEHWDRERVRIFILVCCLRMCAWMQRRGKEQKKSGTVPMKEKYVWFSAQSVRKRNGYTFLTSQLSGINVMLNIIFRVPNYTWPNTRKEKKTVAIQIVWIHIFSWRNCMERYGSNVELE